MSAEALLLAMVLDVVERELEEAERRIKDELIRRLLKIKELSKGIDIEPNPQKGRTGYTFIPAGGKSSKVLVELL